jgi:hypothetical protein
MEHVPDLQNNALNKQAFSLFGMAIKSSYSPELCVDIKSNNNYGAIYNYCPVTTLETFSYITVTFCSTVT